MEYIKLFDSENEYSDYSGGTMVLPNVSYVVKSENVYYNPYVRDYSKEYLTFEITGPGNILWKKTNSLANTKTINYSINDGDWISISASNTTGTAFTVNTGDIVRLKGTNGTYGSNHGEACFNGSTAEFIMYGNITSLVYGDNFAEQTTINPSLYTFQGMFRGCTGLTDASNLVLPAPTIGHYGYASMFAGCTNLVTGPELPATEISGYSYYNMFAGCTSLSKAPTLSFVSMSGISSCGSMFNGCTSLKTAPEIIYTGIGNSCYSYMFCGCTGLTKAPTILPAETLTSNCYQYMFSGCTSLTIAPVLPAKTLTTSCYSSMFGNCTNLNYVKCLATDVSNTSSISGWMYNVAANGTFVKDASISTWPSGANGIPEGWTVVDAS